MASSYCGNTDLASTLRFSFDHALPICYFILGIGGHAVLLIGFNRRAKTEDAYTYQTFLTASKICEIFFMTICLLCVTLGGLIEEGRMGWMVVYWLQFYASHMSMPLGFGFVIVSLLLTLSMSIDRIFAVCWPLIHKNIDKKWHSRCAVGACVGLSVIFSVWDVWQVEMVPVQISNGTNTTDQIDQYYVLRYAQSGLIRSTFGIALGYIRTMIRIMAVLILIIANGILMIVVRRRTKKLQTMTIANREEQKRRLAADRSLIILIICQSCFVLMHQIPMIATRVLMVIAPQMMACYNATITPFVDASVQLADIIDFMVLIIVHKKVRKMFFEVLPLKSAWKKIVQKFNSAKVVTMEPGDSSGRVIRNGYAQSRL